MTIGESIPKKALITIKSLLEFKKDVYEGMSLKNKIENLEDLPQIEEINGKWVIRR